MISCQESWQFNFEKRLFMYQLKWIQIWQNLNLAKMGVFCTFCVIWKYFYHDLVVVREIMFTFVPSKGFSPREGPAQVESSHREAAKTKENAWENLKKCYFLDFWECLKWMIGNSQKQSYEWLWILTEWILYQYELWY